MKKILLYAYAVLVCVMATAHENDSGIREKATVRGHVVNMVTQERLPFLMVSLKGTMIGTSTDESGAYVLRNVPEGKFIIEASAIGYLTSSKEIQIKKGEVLTVNFEVEEDTEEIDEVVISANRMETTRRMAPTLVSVMTSKLFDNTHSSCLAEGLNFQPGLRVETNCQNCGFKQVRMNGLDGHYSQILIDSRPVFSALAGVYGLDQIPTNMIDRVEVMRGGGSALFGSSAIGGTINIITKEPTRNSSEISHTISGIGQFDAFENNTNVNSSFITPDNKLGIAVFSQIRDRDGYDYDDDGFTEMPRLKNQMVGMKTFLKTGDYSKLSFEYHHMHEYRRGGNLIDRPPHEADIAEEIKHDINSGNLNFQYLSPNTRHKLNAYASAQHIGRNSYYGSGQNLNAYGNTKDLTWVVGSQYDYRFHHLLFMPADMTMGLEFNQDRLHDDMWGYNRKIDQIAGIGSFFFQNEWKNEQFNLLVGIRLDKHNMLKKVIFCPRINLRYNPMKNVNLRASYSTGFRAPQAFDEDLHIEAVGGVMAFIRLSDGLKEEKSHSFNLSADLYKDWSNWKTNLLVEGFFTRLNDIFAFEEKTEGDKLYKYRKNESGANVYGGIIECKIAWKKYFQLQAGGTIQHAEYLEARTWSENSSLPAEKRMFRTPNIYGYFSLSSSPLEGWDVSMSGNYTGSMLVEHHKGVIASDRTEKTGRFMEINLKTSYDIKLYKNVILELNIGLQNLFNAYQRDFDKGPDRDSNYIYGPGNPRIFFFGVKLRY
ncbi:MAG: TonB-dependent receptor [Bacteroidales bacterium]|nr:TonB-dependent receptor [Bacteroidales bacterium]MDY6000626.1 TonB-dependent receptor [Candidatus Cryptobacteroides sp.]